MTHAQFHTRAQQIAGKNYLSTRIEVTSAEHGEHSVVYQIYSNNGDHTGNHARPEDALSELYALCNRAPADHTPLPDGLDNDAKQDLAVALA